jgi:hypothetical protein
MTRVSSGLQMPNKLCNFFPNFLVSFASIFANDLETLNLQIACLFHVSFMQANVI